MGYYINRKEQNTSRKAESFQYFKPYTCEKYPHRGTDSQEDAWRAGERVQEGKEQ